MAGWFDLFTNQWFNPWFKQASGVVDAVATLDVNGSSSSNISISADARISLAVSGSSSTSLQLEDDLAVEPDTFIQGSGGAGLYRRKSKVEQPKVKEVYTSLNVNGGSRSKFAIAAVGQISTSSISKSASALGAHGIVRATMLSKAYSHCTINLTYTYTPPIKTYVEAEQPDFELLLLVAI